MSHVLAIAFEDATQGPDCLRTVQGLHDQGQLQIDNAATFIQDAGGKVWVDNIVKSGCAEEELLEKTLNTSLEKKFMTDVQDALKPGSSALLFVVTRKNIDPLITALEPYKGRLLHTSFDSKAEEEIHIL